MSEEDKLLDKIFGDLWKDKYPIGFCDMCGCFYISDENHKQSSCGGGWDKSDEQMQKDFMEFCDFKVDPCEYLTENERQVMKKINSLKRLMKVCFLAGFSEINWDYLVQNDELSRSDKQLFPFLNPQPCK